jgi:hypothetical protein
MGMSYCYVVDNVEILLYLIQERSCLFGSELSPIKEKETKAGL